MIGVQLWSKLHQAWNLCDTLWQHDVGDYFQGLHHNRWSEKKNKFTSKCCITCVKHGGRQYCDPVFSCFCNYLQTSFMGNMTIWNYQLVVGLVWIKKRLSHWKKRQASSFCLYCVFTFQVSQCCSRCFKQLTSLLPIFLSCTALMTFHMFFLVQEFVLDFLGCFPIVDTKTEKVIVHSAGLFYPECMYQDKHA